MGNGDVGALENVCVRNDDTAYTSLSTSIGTLNNRLGALDTRLTSEEESVWFDAYRTSDFTTSDWDTITYTSLRRGKNCAYGSCISTSTGIFTAPKTGVYQFNLQGFQQYGTQGDLRILGPSLNVVSQAHGSSTSGHGDTMFTTVILVLSKGHTVRGQTFKKLRSGSQDYIHFTGVLVALV